MRPSFLRGRPRRGPERRRHVALTKGVEGVGRIGPSEARVCNRVTKIKGREGKVEGEGYRSARYRVTRVHACAGFDGCFDKQAWKKSETRSRSNRAKDKVDILAFHARSLAHSFVQILKIIIVSGAIDIFVGRMTEREGG